jgi:hypothetical protein
MPIYTLETGDGRRLKIEADTPEAATAEADAWAAANPQQSAVSEAFSNIGPSAAQYASDIVAPFLAPVETAKAVGELGKGLYSKAAGALGAKQDPEEKARTEAAANALGEYFKGRYGGAKEIEQTFRKDPVALAGDLATVLSLGGGLVARAPGAIAGPGGAGALGLIAKTGRGIAQVGEAIDPLMATGKAVSATGGLLGKAASELTGVSSGVGAAPIELAYQAGRQGVPEFRASMAGKIDPSESYARAQAGIQGIVDERSANYIANLDKFTNDTKVIDPSDIKKTIDDLKDVTSPRGFTKYENAEAARNDVLNTFERWNSTPGNQFNPVNFDDFKQSLNEIRARYKGDPKADLVVSKTYDKVVKTIEKNAPGYADWMKGYGEMSDLIKEINTTFSLKGNPDTAIRKLQSVMRNNVNTNYGQRKKLIDVLAEYEPSLPYLIAGQALNTVTPRGLAGQAARLQAGAAGLLGVGGAVSPGAAMLAIPSLAASSPRLLGETAYGLGRTAAGVGAVAPYAAPALRTGYQVGRAKEELDRLALESAGLLGQ